MTKLTPMEARVVAALLTGPKTPNQLLDMSGAASMLTLRQMLSRIRSKLKRGNIVCESQYALTGAAADEMRDALWEAAR